MQITCPNGCNRCPNWSWSLTRDNVNDSETRETIETTIGELCDCCSSHITCDEIFERFDDAHTALRYIREHAFIKGLFVGAIITTMICWAFS